MSVVAPAGYGKTTLLAQWAEADPRPFAWVGVDEWDDDPTALLAHISTALAGIGHEQPIGESTPAFAPGLSVWSTLRRSASILAGMESIVLVLDDVHRIQNRDCLDALAALARHVPDGSVLVFSGRSDPPIPVARLRGRGLLVEVGVDELAFDRGQARRLLHEEGITLPESAVASLHEHTEGWPVALYLAALWIRGGGSLDGAALPGSNPAVAEFLRKELFARLSRRQRAFLTRTSVLDRMSGPLCDAVLGTADSTRVLDAMERSNLLLVPLDRRGQWYRYHPLFREMLRAELEDRDPGRVPELLDRAAAWCEANEEPDAAIAYAQAAGDADRVARLVAANAQAFFIRGLEATVGTWFEWLRRNATIDRFAPAAILGVLMDALTGRASEAELWAERIEEARPEGSAPDGSALDSWRAAMRSMLGRGGSEQIRADADLAWRTMSPDSPFRAMSLLLVGLSRILDGELDEAEGALLDAVAEGDRLATTGSIVLGRSELALLALERGDRRGASDLIRRAAEIRDRAGLSEYPISALSHVVAARLALHTADLPSVRRELARAHRLRPGLSRAFPHLSVQVLLELARVHVVLADTAGALTILRDVDLLLQERSDLGHLPRHAAELRSRVEALRVDAQGATSLTTAELQLLPALTSHLSFREIAERRSVSPHTIKTQAISIYRKLGVASRGAAIARAQALGLLQELSSPLAGH